MDREAHEAKQALREAARAARAAIADEDRAAGSRAVARRALALPELSDVRSVLSYGASSEEVDPGGIEEVLRARGVRIAKPRVDEPAGLSLHWVDDDAVLVAGAFGILEPPADAPRAPVTQMDAVLVPGVSFDAEGTRLGYGGGYYDRLLVTTHADTIAIGLAFEEQMADAIPRLDHDVPVSLVVTPERVVRPPAD